MSVGMSIDLSLLRQQWLVLIIAAPVVVVAKTAHHRDPLEGLRSRHPRRGAVRRLAFARR